jgi:hypothetical protein
MVENEFIKVDKVLPNANKSKILHTHAKKEVPLEEESTTKNTKEIQSSVNFKNIYSHYLNEAGMAENSSPTSLVPEHKEIKAAMDDAQTTFETMMQIREELEKEFKGIVSMQ